MRTLKSAGSSACILELEDGRLSSNNEGISRTGDNFWIKSILFNDFTNTWISAAEPVAGADQEDKKNMKNMVGKKEANTNNFLIMALLVEV